MKLNCVVAHPYIAPMCAGYGAVGVVPQRHPRGPDHVLARPCVHSAVGDTRHRVWLMRIYFR